MLEPEQRLRQIAQDVRTGMDDATIMEKYGLSSTALETLYAKLIHSGMLREDRSRMRKPGSFRISSTELLNDIRSGMPKPDLMDKYGISSQTLQRLAARLLASRALPQTYCQWDYPLQTGSAVQENIRKLQRHIVDFDLPVYEESQPELLGKVRDITEEGVGIRGLDARVDEVKKFVILGDLFGEIAPLEFEAKCRWAKRFLNEDRLASGFQIVKISDPDLRELRKLIQLITLRAGS